MTGNGEATATEGLWSHVIGAGLAFAAFVVLPWPCARGQTPIHAPEIVVRGFDAYRVGGADSAVRLWLTNSPALRDSSAVPSAIRDLQGIERTYGRFAGYELVTTVALGSQVVRAYAIAFYRSGPLYMSFDCYRASQGWLITAFLFNTRPEPILPASFIR